MHDETKIGGLKTDFPNTRLSKIFSARSNESSERKEALEALVTAYWKPVYKYIRLKWRKSNEDAKDLTQGFFTKAIEKDYFRSYEPSKARFRTFLRTCLDGYVANENKAGRRAKRGGGIKNLSLDFEGAENEIVSTNEGYSNVEDYFDREWVRNLFDLALKTLEKACSDAGKKLHFEIFKQYDLHEVMDSPRPTYDSLATQHKIPVTQVTNHLAFVRREFRRHLLTRLSEITITEDEFRSEARLLLGIDPDEIV